MFMGEGTLRIFRVLYRKYQTLNTTHHYTFLMLFFCSYTKPSSFQLMNFKEHEMVYETRLMQIQINDLRFGDQRFKFCIN